MKINKDNSYIIKRKNGVYWKISYEKLSGICYQILEQNKWDEKNIIYKNGTENFSVVLLGNDNVYIFCQDIAGSIILCIYNGSEWKQYVLLSRKNSSMDSVYFYAVIYKNDFHLFYNICEKSTNRDILIHQVAYKGEQWSKPQFIDNIKPFDNMPFIVRTDGNDNMYVLYQTSKNATLNLGYKKFSDKGNIWSEFCTLDKSQLGYIDHSFMTINNNVHLLFIKKEKYYTQLMYCCKKNEWKAPVLISEEEQISSCSLFILDKHLWIIWVCGDKIYSSFSADSGESFSKPILHEELTKPIFSKVSYQCNEEKEKNNLIINEIYVEYEDENEIKILVIPQVLPAAINLTSSINEEAYLVENSTDTNLELFKIQFNNLYEKIYASKKQLREKDYKLTQLNYTLEHRNSEILNLEYNNRLLSERIELLGKENEAIKEKSKMLEQKLISYEQHINSLENRIIDKQSEINNLQKRKGDKENEFNSMKNQINVLQNNIEMLRTQLEQKNISLLKKEQKSTEILKDIEAAPAIAKNKSSIIKQFFGFGDNQN